MPLSDMTKARLADWDIMVKQESRSSAIIIAGPGATRFNIASALLTLCEDKTVIAFGLQEHGDVLHGEIQFRARR